MIFSAGIGRRASAAVHRPLITRIKTKFLDRAPFT
jgi:hypothetical protein